MLCYYKLVCVTGILQLCSCQRRLASGIDNILGKKYMVYFVQSPFARNFQNSWVCNGAIVSPTQILTAAACLIQAENIYAIAGYKKFLKADVIDDNLCTRTKKQRVVKFFIPTGYKLDYENPGQRMNIDIGVAVVEKPYKFNDPSYLTHCSHEPQPIQVNYDKTYESTNTRAVALGWVVKEYTEPTFAENNQLLQETSITIVDKTLCTSVTNTQETVGVINKYHFCGTINFQEERIDNLHVTQSFDAYIMRRQLSGHNSDLKDNFGYRKSYNDEENSDFRRSDTALPMNITNNNDDHRRAFNFICQYNFGSPLIKWINNREIIIGITSSTNLNSNCNRPLVYVSTAASSKIIECLLQTEPLIRKICNIQIVSELYEIQEIDIKWPDYQNSKILEPMLLVQRAVLNKIQPLIPRATITYTNRSAEIKSAITRGVIERPMPEQIHLRAQLPFQTQPKYIIDTEHRQKQHYPALSEEVPSTQYYRDRPILKSPLLVVRPHYDIRHEPQKQYHNNPPSAQYARPQYNLNLEYQQPIPSMRESKQDYQQQYRISENQQYHTPTYHQFDSQAHQHREPRYKQSNDRQQENYHDLSLKKQSLLGQLRDGLQTESLASQEYTPLLEQFGSLAQPSQQHNVASGYNLPNKQKKLQITQHKPIENKSIKQILQKSELLYDLSPEQSYGMRDFKNDQAEFYESTNSFQTQHKLYQQPRTDTTESSYQEQLKLRISTTLSDDQYFSFDEIFAQLQEPSFSHQEIPQQFYERGHTNDQPYDYSKFKKLDRPLNKL